MKYTHTLDRVDGTYAARAIRQSPEQFVNMAENRFTQKINALRDTAMELEKHIILLTGPSASGKTTTAKRLTHALRESGKVVERLSLDNFYRPASELPRWEDGYQNYESIEGLDLDCFNMVMKELLRTGEAEFPIFDFSVGRRSKKTFTLRFLKDTYLIIEGIHALNPALSEALEGHRTLKIYISVHSNFLAEDKNIMLHARDLRLSRRLLRDYQFRSTSAESTMKMWEYVLRGEELYIRPFRQYADLHVDSTHEYEPYLYHDGLTILLSEVAETSPYYYTAQRILKENQNFFPIPASLIPPDSLIQEFIRPTGFEESRIPMRDI